MSLIGQNIDRYHIIEQLGQGGMATVYKAFDTRLERDVAIKFIRTGLIGPDLLGQMMGRFEIEGKALARLSHPNIVKVHDYGDHEGSPYLVMEYLSGGTLKERTGRPCSYWETARLLLPVARALAYAHSRKIIHRDVKPGNILVTESGELMLADFGIAKILEIHGNTLTPTGVGVGTPEYMAPEQGQGKPILQTDIYALGVVFFELLTGHKPYTADTPMAVLLKHANEPLPRPQDFVPGIPEEVEQVVFKALAKDPAQRYANMRAFVAALERLAVMNPATVKDNETLVGMSRRDVSTMMIDPAVAALMEMAQKFEQDGNPAGALDIYRQALEKCAAGSGQRGEIAQAVARLEKGPESREKTSPFVEMNGRGISIDDERGAGANGRSPLRAIDKLWWQRWYTWVRAVVLVFACLLAMWGLGAGLLNGFGPATPTVDAQAATLAAIIAASNTPDVSAAQPTSTDRVVDDPVAAEPTQTPTPSLTTTPEMWVGSIQVSEKDGMVMVYVPEGEFEMGSEDGESDEEPVHTVYLDAFWIDQTEVTNAMYATCMADGDCKQPQISGSYSRDSYFGNSSYDDYPLIRVDWVQADAYCVWAGRRLPSEAEWEKAARGTDGRTYPRGENISCDLANYGSCVDDTSEAGSYPDGASPYGALDMAGNVWEWVADWYGEEYYSSSPSSNPAGPSSGERRVVRGGSSWVDDDWDVRSANRNRLDPDIRNDAVGFRCARSK
jgi:formylglycine-generating enzyme required for sulfatase activity/serine/threonine protein kinase